jgi:hypothetical protein
MVNSVESDNESGPLCKQAQREPRLQDRIEPALRWLSDA